MCVSYSLSHMKYVTEAVIDVFEGSESQVNCADFTKTVTT